MQAKEIEALITDLVTPVLEGTDLTLVDVEYVREKDWYLRIFIDKEGGVEIDDCQLVSEKLTTILDEKDPIKDKYFLEVSSPGIERKLTRDFHFDYAMGEKVILRLIRPCDGRREFNGILTGYENGAVTILLEDEIEMTAEKKEIAFVKLDDFNM